MTQWQNVPNSRIFGDQSCHKKQSSPQPWTIVLAHQYLCPSAGLLHDAGAVAEWCQLHDGSLGDTVPHLRVPRTVRQVQRWLKMSNTHAICIITVCNAKYIYIYICMYMIHIVYDGNMLCIYAVYIYIYLIHHVYIYNIICMKGFWDWNVFGLQDCEHDHT